MTPTPDPLRQLQAALATALETHPDEVADEAAALLAALGRLGYTIALVQPAPALDVARLERALPTTEAEWRPFWHRVDEPDGWVVSVYGDKLARHILAALAETSA